MIEGATRGKMAFNVHIWFSIMDSDLIVSQETNQAQSQVPSSVFKILRTDMLMVFKVVGKKTCQVKLQFVNGISHEIVAHDGPGVLSAIVQKSEEYHVCSTFQCIVHVHIFLENTQQEPDMKHFEYFFTELEPTVQLSLREDVTVVVSVPDHACSTNPCVVRTTGVGSQLNVSVKHMDYTGLKSLTCEFGGIFTTENVGGTVPKSYSLCQQYDQEDNRNLYSFTSSLTVVFYWYRHYSALTAILSVSSTSCKAVQVDDCFYQQWCVFPSRLCDMVLDNLVNIWTFDLRLGDLLEDGFRTSRFSLRDGECFVLSIKRRQRKATYCQLTLTHHNVHVSKSEIHFHIVGSLPRGVKHLTLQEEDYSDNIELHKKTSADKTSRRKYHTNSEQDFLVTQHSDHDTNFNFFAKARPNSFHLRAKLHTHRSWWFNIIVNQSVASQQGPEIIPLTVNGYSLLRAANTILSVLFLQHESNNTNIQQTGRVTVKVSIKANFFDPRSTYTSTQEYFWAQILNLSATIQHKFVSLFGQIRDVEVHHLAQDTIFNERSGKDTTDENQVLKATWRNSLYTKYEYFLNKKPFLCLEDIVNRIIKDCYNFSSETHQKMEYILFKTNFNYLVEHSILSWNEASLLCRNVTGYLPQFTNKEELDKLVALLKLATIWGQPLLGLFIGLHLVKVISLLLQFLLPKLLSLSCFHFVLSEQAAMGGFQSSCISAIYELQLLAPQIRIPVARLLK